jgi:pimeloyl-ACP methyl ester carboxylesterase
MPSFARRTRSRGPEAVPEGKEAVAGADAITAPNAWLMMLEARAPWELAALLAVSPWLARIPAGDGHPVLVFPGLGASDTSTLAIRNFLVHRGYTAYTWDQGFNLGPRGGVLGGCRARLEELADKHREKVSLVGWSLGGIYARELAKEKPGLTRCVITLGSPFAGPPKATNAWRLYEFVSGQKAQDSALQRELSKPPPVPTSSIYSKTDGVVAWQCSLNPRAPKAENIEVRASHIGMGFNPLALYAVADRLRQDPQDWQAFDTEGARRWFFKTGLPTGAWM